jgi:hypothetical protein
MPKRRGSFWLVFFGMCLPVAFGADMSAWTWFAHWLNRPRKSKVPEASAVNDSTAPLDLP